MDGARKKKTFLSEIIQVPTDSVCGGYFQAFNLSATT